MTCLYCDQDLSSAATRPAYDPWLGRLWRVCPSCRRWNVVPLEDRWEALEAYERAARDHGRTVLRTEHLDLVRLEGRGGRGGQLIRVGRAPRPELAGWRYGDALPTPSRPGLLGLLRRVLLGMPTSAFGYNAGYGAGMFDQASSARWLASPFVDEASTLTAAFLHVPLAPACPSCGGPLALPPWQFQTLRLVPESGGAALTATCGLCGADVSVRPEDARPALRLGLAIVNRRLRDRAVAESAAGLLDRAHGPEGLIQRLSRESTALGELPTADRLALAMALDEQSEAALLETEWREAEELAAIVDGPLTRVEGFEAFRRRVLG